MGGLLVFIGVFNQGCMGKLAFWKKRRLALFLKWPVPSPQKSALLKGEWDTQGVPSAILSFSTYMEGIAWMGAALTGSPIIRSCKLFQY